MPITFNSLLRNEGIEPAEVRLLRHETRKHRGRTPYSLWREEPDNPVRLERYQSTQRADRRAWFRGEYWASFVVTPDASTLFVGLYQVGAVQPVPPGWLHDLSDEPLDPAADELYDTVRIAPMQEYAGRLVVEWGSGTRTWSQLATNQDKQVIELRRSLSEPPFPGYSRFVQALSEVEALPPSWHTPLNAVGGVYLLTCPRTREQYVGSASGEEGFLIRWLGYARDWHGGDVALRSRDPSDYQVSILQVAGSDDRRDAILAMEALWKRSSRAAKWD